MDEIAMLEKRQDEFDGRLRHTEIALERNNVLTERNTKVSEQFAATLEAIKDTMVQISTATTENGKTVADLTRNVGALTTKINEVDKKWMGFARIWITEFMPSTKEARLTLLKSPSGLLSTSLLVAAVLVFYII